MRLNIPIILALIATVRADKSIGSPCRDRHSRHSGVCKLVHDCPSAEEEINRGQTPTICGYQQFTIPIICCKETSPPQEQPNGYESKAIRYCEKFSSSIGSCEFNNNYLVVGGELVSAGEFPFMAAIGYEDGSWNCGGTLISDNFVLTAAHCVKTRSGKPKRVRMGHVKLSGTDEPNLVESEVDEIITHPQYKPPPKYNDIALIRLKYPVYLSNYVRPACLWTKSVAEHPKALATGWGATSIIEGGSSATLQKVALDIFDNSKCSEVYPVNLRLPFGINETMICAGDLKGGKDTCQGDSGGPLFVYQKGNTCVHHVIGITSFSRSCGIEDTPAIYTRVSEYIPWIEGIIWPNNN